MPQTEVVCPYRSKLVDEIVLKMDLEDRARQSQPLFSAELEAEKPDVDHEGVHWKKPKKRGSK